MKKRQGEKSKRYNVSMLESEHAIIIDKVKKDTTVESFSEFVRKRCLDD